VCRLTMYFTCEPEARVLTRRKEERDPKRKVRAKLTVVSSRHGIAHLDRSLKSRYKANKRPYISRIAEQHRQPWPDIFPGRASDAPESRNLYDRRSGPSGRTCPAVTFVTVDYFVSANLARH
jgi:hypothetical protein